MDRLIRDPHVILGVSPDASDKQVRKRYRRLCKSLHPDLNPDDPRAEQRFKEVQWAYQSLLRLRQGKDPGGATWTHPSSLDPHVDSPHPFLGFFDAVRAYCSGMRTNKES
jgi:curved DNA-binding protein CbpA